MTTEYKGFEITSNTYNGRIFIGVNPLNAEKFDMDEKLDLNESMSTVENTFKTEDEGIENAKQDIDIFLSNNIYTEFGYEPIKGN